MSGQETEHKSFAKPNERWEFPRGRAEILKSGGGEGDPLVVAWLALVE
jgi:hypothetical protein